MRGEEPVHGKPEQDLLEPGKPSHEIPSQEEKWALPSLLVSLHSSEGEFCWEFPGLSSKEVTFPVWVTGPILYPRNFSSNPCCLSSSPGLFASSLELWQGCVSQEPVLLRRAVFALHHLLKVICAVPWILQFTGPELASFSRLLAGLSYDDFFYWAWTTGQTIHRCFTFNPGKTRVRMCTIHHLDRHSLETCITSCCGQKGSLRDGGGRQREPDSGLNWETWHKQLTLSALFFLFFNAVFVDHLYS